MRVNRKPARNGPSIPGVLVSFAVVVGVSFILAVLWHRSDSRERPVTLYQPLESSAPSQPQTTDSSHNGPLAEDPATSPTNGLGESELPMAPHPELFSRALEEMERVDDTFFDDAVFVGDSTSTAISRYGMAMGAQVIAMPGLTPDVALSVPLFSVGSGQEATLLEVMRYQGNPAKVYILLGADGLAAGLTPEDLTGGYRELVRAIRTEFPGVHIYIQSVFPVTAAYGEANPSASNAIINQYNLALMDLAAAEKAYYLHPAEVMCDADGVLPAQASPVDGLHISAEYHVLWFDYLRTHAVQKK